jgi:hypothetical protein
MYNYCNYNDFAMIVLLLLSFFEVLEFFEKIEKLTNSLCTKYNLQITWIQSIYNTHTVHMYILIYYHMLMGKLHLVHHYKPIHLRIYIIHFEYQEGYYSFGHICIYWYINGFF